MATRSQRSVGQPAVASATLTPPPAVADTSRFTVPSTSPTAGRDAGTAAFPGTGSTGAGAPPPGSDPAAARAGPLGVGATFGPRYHIIRELGAGGMGAVYQAWDAELGVAVAVKVILPEVLADPQAAVDLERRFKRELLLARQVTHKNVVRIHDLGEIGGIKYITMSYVEGEDLATTLKREGTLAVPRVVAIARQVASGMQAAHEAGVVHRDLKPANIMVDREDRALIMDFGIALSSERGEQARRGAHAPPPALAASQTLVGPATGDGATLLGAPSDDGATVMGPPGTPRPPMALATGGGTVLSSSAGFIIGTLEYMAPEQSRGDPVDQRTDIYAFGMILSDLLLGRRQLAEGTTAWDELQDRVSKPPVPLRERNADVPEALDAIVTRCTQVDPGQRFQTTAELVTALHRLDADGHLIPETKLRRFTPRIVGAAAILVASLVGATYWVASRPGPVVAQPAPVSVLVADFENTANDPVFDGLLEQALTVGVEGASFVTAYPRRDALRVAAQLRPEHGLDEPTAVLVALREGVQRVLTGSIGKIVDRYQLSIKIVEPSAVDASASKVLMTWTTEARNRDEVLGAVAKMAARVREELGDTTASAGAVRPEESFTAASLEAARAYATAQELQWAGKVDEAIGRYGEAIQLDPDMGRAYSGLAAQFANVGRAADAERNYEEALARIDRMTDREKFRTRGAYYLFARKPDLAMKEFASLVQAYPADSSGLTNLALAAFYQRDMAQALEQGSRATAIFPKNVLRRSNLALYAMYAGQFETAITEADAVHELNPTHLKAFVSKALSLLALGRVPEARAAYEQLAGTGAAGASFATAGLADLAHYEGRLADAAALLEKGIAANVGSKNAAAAAAARVALAEVRLAQGNPAAAAREANLAAAGSDSDVVRAGAGLALAAAGRTAQAEALAKTLADRLEADPQAYGRLVRAELALAGKEPRAAVEHAREAQKLADTWPGRVMLGRAYLALNAFPEAYAEFEVALKRRGEATAVYLDDMPSYRRLAPVHYYMGLAQEGLKSPAATESFKTFLAIKTNGDERGLVADARRRVENR